MNRLLLLGSALPWVLSGCGGSDDSNDTTVPSVTNPQRGTHW